MTEAKYRLREVTDRQGIKRGHTLNFLEWGQGLTLEEYLQREVHLGSQTSCSNGNLRFWTLEEQYQVDGSAEWTVVACLETLTRPSLYKIKGRPVQSSVSHSIGAVFTPEEHRGKGHAKRLLNSVVHEFDNRNSWSQYKGLSEEALTHSFSALWSDIGLYYEKFGYKLTGSDELVIKVGSGDDDNAKDEGRVDGINWITEDQIPALCKDDEAQLSANMDSDTETDGITRVAISPTEHVHELTHARAHYLAPLFRGTHLESNGGDASRFGAVLDGVWVLWSHDFGNNKLNILRVHNKIQHDDDDVQLSTAARTAAADKFVAIFIKLLQAAETEARAWGLQKVVLWKQDLPRVRAVAAADGSDGDGSAFLTSLEAVSKSVKSESHVETRADSSLPMWRFWEGSTRDPTTGARIEWIMDGKYAWF